MALFKGALSSGSLGAGLALQGQPETYANIAQENIRYKRSEEERKRREQEKKDADAAEKYDSIIKSLKVEGYDPIYNQKIKQKAGEVIGELNNIYSKNKSADPFNSSEFTKKLQDFQIYADNAKQASKALAEDYGLTSQGKFKLNEKVSEALKNNDYESFKSALGGNEFYRRGTGVEGIETPFNFVEFKNKVNNAYKPFEKTIETQDPNTGLFTTKTNQYYENPLAATSEVLASDPKAGDFFVNQFKGLSKEKQKEYSDKALTTGGTGNAYMEYAKERLFPEQGLKAKTTLQQPKGGGNLIFGGGGATNGKITFIPSAENIDGKDVSSININSVGGGNLKITTFDDGGGNKFDGIIKRVNNDGTVVIQRSEGAKIKRRLVPKLNAVGMPVLDKEGNPEFTEVPEEGEILKEVTEPLNTYNKTQIIGAYPDIIETSKKMNKGIYDLLKTDIVVSGKVKPGEYKQKEEGKKKLSGF